MLEGMFSDVVAQIYLVAYSQLLLSPIPRDTLKYFAVSVPQHIRFAELRKK